MSQPILPWSVAAICALVAALSIARSSPQPPDAAPVASPDVELGALRARLATMESEAGALRAELDRMRAMLAMKKMGEEQASASGDADLTVEQKRERLKKALGRLDDLVPELHRDPPREVFEQLQDVLMAMIYAPNDEPGPFLEKYQSASDPLMKMLLLPQVAGRLKGDLTPFIAEQLEQVQDPDLRVQLIASLRAYSSPAEDEQARSILIGTLAEEKNPQARRFAIEALSGLGRPESEAALFDAATGDSDPATREAAIRSLAEQPGNRDRLLEALESEPDERLRGIGECAVRLAGPS